MSVLSAMIVRCLPIPIRSARPAEAVPPGRMRHGISEDRVLLHTIQMADAFGALLSNGARRSAPALAEPPLHADGYDWMFRQMDARELRADDVLQAVRIEG